jgi:ribosomal protein S4
LKFNRPKWAVIKKALLRQSKKIERRKLNRVKFFSKKRNKNKKYISRRDRFPFLPLPGKAYNISRTTKYWVKLKKTYKNDLLTKKLWLNSYDSNANPNFIKKKMQKISDRKEALKIFFLSFEFRVDVLLWNLKYFLSTYEASNFIKNGHVLVNGVRISSTIYLKEGDKVTFINFNKILKRNYLKYNPNHKIYNGLVEIDYYTNTILILKDAQSASLRDLSMITIDHIDVRSLINKM